MKKYLVEIVLYFMLPLVAMGVVFEYSLRQIPNDYAHKNRWLTQNSSELEVLLLGSSCVLYGVNPSFIKKKAFNAAYFSQSLKYDHFIFNKFIDQMPSLEYIIIGIDYWSPFASIEESPEWWRIKYYNIHYGSKFHRWEGKYNFELYFRDFDTFERAGKGFLTLFGLMNESQRISNELGYGTNYTLNNRSDQWDDDEPMAIMHNDLIAKSSKENIDENKYYLEMIIEESAKNNVKVMLVNFPLHKSYRDSRNEEFVYQEKEFCRYFDKKYENVSVLDFSANSNFNESDFFDPNHLNEYGAEKLTQILDSIMVDQNNQNFTKNRIL